MTVQAEIFSLLRITGHIGPIAFCIGHGFTKTFINFIIRTSNLQHFLSLHYIRSNWFGSIPFTCHLCFYFQFIMVSTIHRIPVALKFKLKIFVYNYSNQTYAFCIFYLFSSICNDHDVHILSWNYRPFRNYLQTLLVAAMATRLYIS